MQFVETTVYDVYADVDGIETLLDTCANISNVKKTIDGANDKYPGIIVKSEDFNAAVTIGNIERSANVRIEPRAEIA